MQFSSKYTTLGEAFYISANTAEFANPKRLLWNTALAKNLALDTISAEDAAEIFSGQTAKDHMLPALAYSGHQFGHFNPRLGDGRAHLLGDALDQDGLRWELHLKGSGPTPFSRGGDGFCALGPAIREYVMSEAMHALGVPTCRTLCVVTTGHDVIRDQPAPMSVVPGAVVARVAASHIRIGTFQYFAQMAHQSGKNNDLKALFEHTISTHYPQIDSHIREPIERCTALLTHFIDAQIQLVCEWLRVGFIHGVMNTDNMLLSGDTIDYGPCAMMENYNPDAVFSSIDRRGRYAFSSQPDIALWNTTRFAETLLELFPEAQTETAEILGATLATFKDKFARAHQIMLHRKFGIEKSTPNAMPFIQEFLKTMQQIKADYTNTFVALSHLNNDTQNNDLSKNMLAPELLAVIKKYNIHYSADMCHTMKSVNPRTIPRNHHVERVIHAAVFENDVQPALHLIEALKTPYDYTKNVFCDENTQDNYRTFCGT